MGVGLICVVVLCVLSACAKPRSPLIAGDLVTLFEPSNGALESLLEPEITGDSWLLVLFGCMFALCAQNRFTGDS